MSDLILVAWLLPAAWVVVCIVVTACIFLPMWRSFGTRVIAPTSSGAPDLPSWVIAPLEVHVEVTAQSLWDARQAIREADPALAARLDLHLPLEEPQAPVVGPVYGTHQDQRGSCAKCLGPMPANGVHARCATTEDVTPRSGRTVTVTTHQADRYRALLRKVEEVEQIREHAVKSIADLLDTKRQIAAEHAARKANPKESRAYVVVIETIAARESQRDAARTIMAEAMQELDILVGEFEASPRRDLI